MTTSNNCATCKHWNLENAEYYMGLGVCKAAPLLWNACTWDDAGNRVFAPGTERCGAFVQDSSDYFACLYTRPTFGCVQHTEKETPS